MSTDDEEEESQCCYERYRILVQNECAGGESVLSSICLSLVSQSLNVFSLHELLPNWH